MDIKHFDSIKRQMQFQPRHQQRTYFLNFWLKKEVGWQTLKCVFLCWIANKKNSRQTGQYKEAHLQLGAFWQNVYKSSVAVLW